MGGGLGNRAAATVEKSTTVALPHRQRGMRGATASAGVDHG
jgi:hypothetical protein